MHSLHLLAGSFISCQPDSLCQRSSRWEFHSIRACCIEGEIQFVKADFASAVPHMKYRRSFKTLKRLFHILVVLYFGEMKLIFNYDKTTAFPNFI
jgi:hypothetical protein